MGTIWSRRRRGRELSVSLRVIFVTRCGAEEGFMSKSRIGMAAAGVAMVALGALPSAAEAGFRLRVGGPVGVARFARASMLSVAGLRHARMAARHSRVRTAALRPQD